MVCDYNKSQLRYPVDALNAFARILPTLSRIHEGGFFCDVPGMFLDLVLHWQPLETSNRREERHVSVTSHAHVASSGHACPTPDAGVGSADNFLDFNETALLGTDRGGWSEPKMARCLLPITKRLHQVSSDILRAGRNFHYLSYASIYRVSQAKSPSYDDSDDSD